MQPFWCLVLFGLVEIAAFFVFVFVFVFLCECVCGEEIALLKFVVLTFEKRMHGLDLNIHSCMF